MLLLHVLDLVICVNTANIRLPFISAFGDFGPVISDRIYRVFFFRLGRVIAQRFPSRKGKNSVTSANVKVR